MFALITSVRIKDKVYMAGYPQKIINGQAASQLEICSK